MGPLWPLIVERACEILEPHKLVMVLEPLHPLRRHPGMFLTPPQAYLVCPAVGILSCEIQYDNPFVASD